MRRARDGDDFAADPVGRFVIGATHFVWCHSPTLCGSQHWGRPTEDDARQLIRAFDLALHPRLGGFDVLMDLGAIEFVDWRAYSVMTGYVVQRLAEWSRRIQRHATVLPSGPLGFLLAGMVPVLGGGAYPQRFFATRAEAVAWLARDELSAICDEVDTYVDHARGLTPSLRRLRDYLDHAVDGATLDVAARALATSPRSLQRELRAAGTSFSVQLAEARIRVVCGLLVHSDEKVEVIARRVGWSSSSQLNAIFRRVVGETPAQFRARHRNVPVPES